jgi:diaminohydroxyphosphoribosylaminopyrimidine deaminase/5-amino-6-(5-phosphoribosylamino)uracil reductase
VLIGAGTARADDPVLTVRGLGITRQPVRLVAARTLDLSPDGALGRSAGEVPLWLLHGPSAPDAARAAWAARGARLIACAEGPDGLSPADMLARLGHEGLTRVFCEGGGRLAASLFQAGLADEIALFTAGLALGADARPAVGPLSLARLADAARYHLAESRQLGPDLCAIWSRPDPACAAGDFG